MSINIVAISGNLTRDCEVRNGASGTAVTRFTVAVNERRKNQFGEYEDCPNYVDCVVFGKYGEAIAESLKRGAKVTVGGSLRYSTWEKDGQKRSKLEVVANSVDLPPRHTQAEQQTSIYDDDCPF